MTTGRGRSPRSSNEAPPGRGCQLAELFAVLGRPHVLPILYAFEESGGVPIRFGDLQDRLKIAPKTLSQRLRVLVEAGFLARRAYNEIPPRVEYEPTAKTRELGDIFRSLHQWTGRHDLHPVPSVSVVGRLPARGLGPSPL